MQHTPIAALILLVLSAIARAQRGSDQPAVIANVREVPETVDTVRLYGPGGEILDGNWTFLTSRRID